MNRVLYWGTAVLTGAFLAVVAAYVTLMSLQGSYRSGPWRTSIVFGSVEADMYTRARVAIHGLLALDRRETMYYAATTDSEGDTLSGDCTYRVEGGDLAAHWWSITAYDDESFLIANERKVYSFSQTTTERGPDGSFVIRISAEPQESNWLPVKRGERFDLTARFYNPEASIYADPSAAVLPAVVKEGCK